MSPNRESYYDTSCELARTSCELEIRPRVTTATSACLRHEESYIPLEIRPRVIPRVPKPRILHALILAHTPSSHEESYIPSSSPLCSSSHEVSYIPSANYAAARLHHRMPTSIPSMTHI